MYRSGAASDYGDISRDSRHDMTHYSGRADTYQLPVEVQRFLVELCSGVANNNVHVLRHLYEERLPLLNQEYFEEQPWPEADEVMAFIGESNVNDIFMVLYKELYYRHLYALPAPNLKPVHRFESYFNYCSLFNLILSTDQPLQLDLPDQWLWNIVDEFIYQFQTFTQYRSRLAKRSVEELELMHDNATVWNVLSVLNVLHSLVEKSEINQQLEVFASGGDPSLIAGQFGRHPLYKMLGYFSLIGLLRLHSLLGDYYQALKVLDNIELHKKGMYARVPACQITTFYYVGFCYLMMRRYGDAIRTFSNVLLYIQRTKLTYHLRGYQSDLVNKQTEQMLTLLAMCLVLHPQSIDESVQTVLSEKYADKMLKMARGVREEFESAFVYACPKFLSPVTPDVEPALAAAASTTAATPAAALPAALTVDLVREPQRQQLRVFMDELDQQLCMDMVARFGGVATASDLAALATTASEALATCQQANQELADAMAGDEGGAGLISTARAAAERAQMAAKVAGERAAAAVEAAVAANGLDPAHADPALLREVSVPTIRSYLRLYTSMSVGKMADFLGVDQPRLSSYLLCFKHKMTNTAWTEGSDGSGAGALHGQFQSDSEIDFYIDDDMIHIGDTKVAQRYGDFFIRQIHKLNDLTRNVAAIKV